MSVLLAAVNFRKVGKLHYYPAEGLGLEVGSFVVAETERGLECGEVKILREVDGGAEEAAEPYRIVRAAGDDDRQTTALRATQATDGIREAQDRADSLCLPMKIVDGEVALDGRQITLYFVSDTRIDFRQLVKETAARLQMRVHLHQVGARDHAKALGGYGPCGRPLCCTTFLRDFAPVSMKMAKDQSLYLNPSKFSGVCGKLMCCLRYEHDVYMEARDRLPAAGMSVVLPDGGKGVITEVNIFHETVTVVVRTDEETRSVVARADEVTIARACGDCGSAGGGCGGACGSVSGGGGCAPAKVEQKPIQLEQRWRRNWGTK